VLSLVVSASVIAIGACDSSSPTSEAVPAPRGLPAFYGVPAGVNQRSPGTLLKSEAVAVPGVRGTARRLMYVSTDARGRPAAVTGLLFVPTTPPPRRGYPVVSWAHGTNGMAAVCAPSLSPAAALPSLTVLNAMLEQGWAVVATDYQGEGTPPGLLPFLVGDVAARNAIDIVLAARRIPSARTGGRYIVWGHSEGGHSALFAWRLGATYGSRAGLRMVAAVAGAPPSQLAELYQFLTPTPSRVFLYMMLAGFNAAYGNRAAPLDDVLTPQGQGLLPLLRQECLASLGPAVIAQPFDQVVKANPFDLPAWRRLFTRNDPAAFGSGGDAPLLIVHGAADDVIPASTSGALADNLCRLGADLERWVYVGQSHGGVLTVSAPDLGLWMADRFASPTSSVRYRPSDEARVQVDDCQ
jgi:pimeloyl-ACP methyl ester carboxylesterase